MNREKLKIALAEAERFVKIAKAVPPPVERRFGDGNPYTDDRFPPKHGGSVRRSSMDLTRALADLRRVG